MSEGVGGVTSEGANEQDLRGEGEMSECVNARTRRRECVTASECERVGERVTT